MPFKQNHTLLRAHNTAHRWADYAVNEVEEEEEMLLPESMWSIHSVLQPGSSDRVSARLTERRQLAQTAYSIVYTAVLDGEKTVVVKVSKGGLILIWKGLCNCRRDEQISGCEDASEQTCSHSSNHHS